MRDRSMIFRVNLLQARLRFGGVAFRDTLGAETYGRVNLRRETAERSTSAISLPAVS